ncbi:GNAT family N-acetyltransferase [Algibacter sp. 2305UL17-15]|uniref:GNAT family N-acetyltransferase n=1 Tax=Algibacter sp. 2305UL17-15 TaxID=3231268 RepID=UPI0034587CB8
MKDFKVIKYSSLFYNQWNDFVASSKNATFLFHRDFMEYHQDRFDDFSLLMFKGETLISILPANKVENKIYSHQGLSYGGLVFSKTINFETVLETVKVLLLFLKDHGIKTLVLKQIPRLYFEKPSDEIDYICFLLQAKLSRRDMSIAIDLKSDFKYATLRKRKINKAKTFDLNIAEDNGFSVFWNEVLVPNLKATYNVQPVHSVEEITMLQQKFPNNIKQFNVFDDSGILAGCTVFISNKVVHLQYIATKKNDKKGALDYLINHLITDTFKDKAYFDFGISNEMQGTKLNLGLVHWKQGFGGAAVSHDFYEVDVENYELLEDIII